jgi:hypothetical protein
MRNALAVMFWLAFGLQIRTLPVDGLGDWLSCFELVPNL